LHGTIKQGSGWVGSPGVPGGRSTGSGGFSLPPARGVSE
jgi:hypothetical protein